MIKHFAGLVNGTKRMKQDAEIERLVEKVNLMVWRKKKLTKLVQILNSFMNTGGGGGFVQE